MDSWTGISLTFIATLLSVAQNSIQQNGFLGCYDDQLGKIFEGLFQKSFGRTEMVSACFKFCRSSKRRYAGAKFHSTHMNCFCGNVTRNNNRTTCEVTCPRTGIVECAGPEAIGLYDTWFCATGPCKNNAACKDINADRYKCTCTEGWTGAHCDEENEVSHSNAINVAVPIILTAGLIIALVIFLLIRRKRSKSALNISRGENSPGVVNNDYTGYQTHPAAQSSLNNYTPESFTYQYAEIPLEGFHTTQYTDSSNESLKPSCQYNAMNTYSSPNVTTCSNYSHLVINQAILNTTAADTYSHMALLNDKSQHQTTSSTTSVDDTYNKLQNFPQLKLANKKEYDSTDDSVYNRAIAGGHGRKNVGFDEYSHLNTINREILNGT